MSLDMITAGNSYDEASNTMSIGPIENCSASPAPGNNDRHIHIVHIILQDAEDVVAWTARLNYDGSRMRPSSFNSAPFADGSRGQNVSFTNLPIDPATGVHRDLLTAGNIPPAAPEAQTAVFGAIYNGPQNAQVSPDTPPKIPPDDTSYAASGGGVLAALSLQVLPGQAGQSSLTIDLDDNNPNGPLGTELEIFNGTGQQTVPIAENALFDGYHAEGTTCVPPAGIPPVQGEDPGLPDTSTPEGNGTGAGTPAPGATAPGGPGTGDTPTATDGAGPGDGARDSPTPDGESPGTQGTEAGDGDDGTPAWVYALVVIVIALATGVAFAAWRFRSRLPWLRR